MRLSTSPFPFDPSVTAVPPASVAPATAATQDATDASFGDLLQAESNSTPRASAAGPQPTSTGSGDGRPAGPTGAVVCTAGTAADALAWVRTELGSDLASLALANMATTGESEAASDSPALPGGEDLEDGPRPAKAGVPAGPQADMAAIASLLASLIGGGGASNLPIENVQLTIAGQSYDVSAKAPNGASLGMSAGQVLAPGMLVLPRAVQTAYTGMGPQGAGAMPAIAANPEPTGCVEGGNSGEGEPLATAAATATPIAVDSFPEIRSQPAGVAETMPTSAAFDEAAMTKGSVDASATPTAAQDSSTLVAVPSAIAMQDTSAAERASRGHDAPPIEATAAQAESDRAPSESDDEVTGAADAGPSPRVRLTRGGGDVALPTGAKIAVRIAPLETGERNGNTAGQKQSLSAGNKNVTGDEPVLGTNTAKTKAPMPASASTPAYPTRPNEPSSSAAVPLTFDAIVKDATGAPNPELARAAHRAVDSAMAMAEHFSTGAQRGVSLQFTVSGVDLAVRVEMRADGVHTVFRTDSPELRSALAQEWQSVVSTQTPDAAQRLVEPVFTSTPSAASTSSDSGMASQRDPANPQRQHSSEPAAQRSAFAASPRRAAASVTVPTAAPTRPIALSTVRHLHTFA